MEVSSSHQVYVFLLFVAAGMACGAFFDIQRFLRKIIKAGIARTCLEDVVFASACVTLMILLSYYYNNGEIRYYQVMGSVSGMLFYGALLSRLFMKILSFILLLIKKVIWFPLIRICHILLVPLRKIAYLLKRFYIRARKLIAAFVRSMRKRKKALKKRIKML